MNLTAEQKTKLRRVLSTELDRRQRIREECSVYENDLYEFVRGAWTTIDSSDFLDHWAIEALCRHLEAVTRGWSTRLLANYPPRCAKTNVTSICWPIWTWLQRERTVTSGPQVRFLCASYGDTLSLQNANAMRQLLESPWFREHWGDRLGLRADQNSKSDYANKFGGKRVSTSIHGSLIGLGGDIIIVDDPHNTERVESAPERESSARGWRELSTTRLNDPKRSAIVVIMQRLHEEDVSGVILSSQHSGEWSHLMLPMRYDPQRHCVTYMGEIAPFWEDPRHDDGELLWPDRFGEKEVENLEVNLGPYMASGRLQQSPEPVGGGIIKRNWWQLWPAEGYEPKLGEPLVYPPCSYIAVSIDTNYGQREENDWSACTCWGVWYDQRERPKLVLMEAWRVRAPLRGVYPPGAQTEEERKPHWGLVEKAMDTVRRRKAHAILIEDKTRGRDLSDEIRRLLRDGESALHLVQPVGDKLARLTSVEPLFADGMIYAPDKAWAEMVISEMTSFPRGKHDDLVDTCSMALLWMRKSGLLLLGTEADADNIERNTFRSRTEPRYDV